MGRPSPNDELLAAIRALSRVDLENRLMRLSARELAVAMRFTADCDRSAVLRALPPAKAVRVREELALQARRRVAPADYLAFVRQVVAGLRSASAVGTLASYLRPRRR